MFGQPQRGAPGQPAYDRATGLGYKPAGTRVGDYSAAVARGTSVVARVHNTFGGRTPAASRRLRRLARRTGNRISPEEAALSSTARRFQAYYSQRLSVAAVRSCAFLIRRHHRSARRSAALAAPRRPLMRSLTLPMPMPPRLTHPPRRPPRLVRLAPPALT